MRKRIEKRLVDKLVCAYVEWCEACHAERDAYRRWTSATGTDAEVAFMRYTAALDTEELAAQVYAGLVRRVGRIVAADHDLGVLWVALHPETGGDEI